MANLSPGTLAGLTSSTEATLEWGGAGPYETTQPASLPASHPTPLAALLSSVVRNDCSRGGGNCLWAGTPAAYTSSVPKTLHPTLSLHFGSGPHTWHSP